MRPWDWLAPLPRRRPDLTPYSKPLASPQMIRETKGSQESLGGMQERLYLTLIGWVQGLSTGSRLLCVQSGRFSAGFWPLVCRHCSVFHQQHLLFRLNLLYSPQCQCHCILDTRARL